MADSPPVPDDKRLFLLLRKTGLDEEEAYTFVQELGHMAAANLITRFESKFESKLDALAASQNAKLDALRWMIGGGFALLGILITLLRLLG